MADAPISLDTYALRWQVVKESPTFSQYLLSKSPFIAVSALVVLTPAWYFIDVLIGVIVALFVIFIWTIILFFLAQVDRDETIVYTIDSNGVAAGKVHVSYNELNKTAMIDYLKTKELPYQEWIKDLDKESDLVVGSLKLGFITQKTRQQAIQSLLHFLG